MSATTGSFEVKDFGSFKLHIYANNDALGDMSFIVEGDDKIVLMEYPLFKVNVAEFDQYATSLGKPIESVVTSYHTGGPHGVKVVIPEGMKAFMNGEIYQGMLRSFRQAFGDSVAEVYQGEAEEVAFDKKITLAGIEFVFMHGPACDFPGASILIGGKVLYLHWAPMKGHINHNEIMSSGSIDPIIASIQAALATGAQTFVGGHGVVSTPEDANFKIAYLNDLKRLKETHKTPEDLADAIKAAHPGLFGEGDLINLAGNLLK